MSEPEEIQIAPFTPGYERQVVGLIVPIQREEFGVAITAEEQPDLLSIPSFYQRGGGNFWLALRGPEVVGTLALLDIGAGQGALRKMFVRREFRGARPGVARRLLEALLAWAPAHGIGQIFLGTTTKYLAAHRFYEKNGFVPVDRADLLPAFPVMAVDSLFYRRDLGA